MENGQSSTGSGLRGVSVNRSKPEQHADRILVNRNPTMQRKILSKAAQAIIQAAQSSGKHDEKYPHNADAPVEPAFMAPSLDAAQYSSVRSLPSFPHHVAHLPKWCSLCNDFGSMLVLCCGCRVGMCVKTHETGLGCFGWSEEIEKDSFVFYCICCAWAKVGECPVSTRMPPTNPAIDTIEFPQLILAGRRGRVDRRNILFRYDPPVLIVGATWHQKTVAYAGSLYRDLQQAYFGHEDYVRASTAWAPRPCV